ncbi:MAG: HAMP domain-containing sensor histidine kinase [Filomicrobium sp.]
MSDSGTNQDKPDDCEPKRDTSQSGDANEAKAGSEHQPGSKSGSVSSAPPIARRSYLQKMAHELKTPLSAIVAASEIMRDEQLGPIGDERYRHYAADIHDSAKLLIAIVDRMMAQRGRDGAQKTLEFKEVEPIALLHATISSMLPLAERSGIRLSLVEPPMTMPKVIADVLTLKQILINLITNALKFTPKGGQVAATASYEGGDALSFIIKDTGCGMDDDEIRAALAGKLTEGKERVGGGLGVGLPLVKNLASLNGARFVLKSAPGEGTEATLAFPHDRVVLV